VIAYGLFLKAFSLQPSVYLPEQSQNITHNHNMLKYFIDTNQYIVYDLSKLQKKALT